MVHYNPETKQYYLPKQDTSRVGSVSQGLFNNNVTGTVAVDSYGGNGFDIYKIGGNVAEMVADKGISRGGGWRSPGYDVRIKSIGIYKGSAFDLGFRCFMEVIEE